MSVAEKSKSEKPKGGLAQGTARRGISTTAPVDHVLDTTMTVTTPENISFDYQIAGPFRRVFAYVLDLLISLGGYSVFCLLVYLISIFALIPLAVMVGGGPLVEAIIGVLGGLISIGYFLVYWFYGAYMETYFNGQTFGKRVTGMRVISSNGHAIDGVQATLRNFFRLLDIMPFVPLAALFDLDEQVPIYLPTFLFGLVIMTLSRNFQRAGDLVAGTIVVTEELKRRPNLASFVDDRVPKLAELIPAGYFASTNMARVIAEYVDQRKYLPFQRASEIASHLAVPLMDRMGIRPDTDHDLFLCALYYRIFASSENGDAPLPVGTSMLNDSSKLLPENSELPSSSESRTRNQGSSDSDDDSSLNESKNDAAGQVEPSSQADVE